MMGEFNAKKIMEILEELTEENLTIFFFISLHDSSVAIK